MTFYVLLDMAIHWVHCTRPPNVRNVVMGSQGQSITREEALERVLLMAQNAWSDDVKQECLRRAEELRR